MTQPRDKLTLPRVVGYLTVELQGLRPAGLFADGTNDGEHVGSDGTLAIVILIIGGTASVCDESILDGTLHMGGHFAIETFLHAHGHRHLLVVAIFVAMTVGSQLVERIHTRDHSLLPVNILAHLPTQAMIALSALIVEATQIAISFLAKQNFLISFHDDCIFLHAKVSIKF